MTPFELLFSRCVASSLLKQQNLSKFLGQHNWNLDLNAGQADFGEERVYPVQIIGTEAEDSATWLWAWANKASGIPAPLLECADHLRALGEQQEIVELVRPELDLETVNGHMMTMIASAICDADAYYRGPYDGGAVFFPLQGTPLAHWPPAEPVAFIGIMSSCLTDFPVHHKLMVQSLLESQGYSLQETDDQITATSPNGKIVAISFDQSARINSMETTATPETRPEGKPWWKFNG